MALLLLPRFVTLRAQMAKRRDGWVAVGRRDKIEKWSRRLAEYDDETGLIEGYCGFFDHCAGSPLCREILACVETETVRRIAPLRRDDIATLMRGTALV